MWSSTEALLSNHWQWRSVIRSHLTDLCELYRSVCGSEQWTELIGASHLSSEGHCCLLIQCLDKLAQIKLYTQQWMMSSCPCECMLVHVDISLSQSASLIFGNQISIRFEWMTKTSQLGQGRGLDWRAEGRKKIMRDEGSSAEYGWGERWKEKRVRRSGVGGRGCSSITSHSGPGVGFSKTDSERSGLDSISHKSWHVTLMDVAHKASRSDMRRATRRTMGKCECSRLMSTRPGSEEGMMEGRKDRDVERSWGIEKNERAERRMWKSTEFVGTR